MANNEHRPTAERTLETLPSLFTNLIDEVTELLDAKLTLFRVEMKEKKIMAKEPTTIQIKKTTDGQEPTKRKLESQIGKTRETLSNTVEEIRETAEQWYAQVKESVSGVLDYREQFQKEPLVWSLG